MNDIGVGQLGGMIAQVFVDVIGSTEWAGLIGVLFFTIFGAFTGLDMGLILLIDLPLIIYLTSIQAFPSWVTLIILLGMGLVMGKRWHEGTL